MANHVPSTPIRIPETDISLIERERLNMLQWSHRQYHYWTK
jgi:hypothetical protein